MGTRFGGKSIAERRKRLEQRALENRMQQIEQRIAGQRRIFDRLPLNEQRQSLKLAMLERAWWLLDEQSEVGCAAADALLEFVPEADAMTLLEQFFETRNEFNPELYAVRQWPTLVSK